MYKKNRFYLNFDHSSRFVDSITGREFLSVKLLELYITTDSAKWVLEATRDGEYVGLIEGALGSAQPLPVTKSGSWVALSIPLTLHKKKGKKQFSPDFIFNIPGNVTLEV